jgi:hypothetical protein
MNKLLEKLESITGEINQTTKTVYDIINSIGIITGSSAWGVDSTYSDIDVILPPDNISFNEIIQYHNGLYLHEDEENKILHYFQEDFQSCYVLYENKIYNLLLMHSIENYNKWVYATLKMAETIKDDILFQQKIINKKYRIECFEGFKEEY